MPFGDGRAWIVPWKRVQGFPASEVNDATAGASSNVQTIIDNVRRYRGVVADITARNALTSLSDGDWVLILDDGSTNAAIQRYKLATTTWIAVASGGGGGASNSSGLTDLSQDTGTTVNGTRTYGYKAGVLRYGTSFISVSAGTLVVANNTTSYVEVDNTGAVSSNTTGFTSGRIPMATVVAASGSITTVTDKRAFMEFDYGSTAQGTPVLIGTGNGSTTTYTLPYSKTNEIVWKGGALQLAGTDYTVSGGVVTFTSAPVSGEEVMATASMVVSSNPSAYTMGTPILIGTGNGSTTSFTLPYTGQNETVWKGGAIQLGGAVDYTNSGGTITFTSAPASGVKIIATAAQINNITNLSGSSAQGAPMQIGTGDGSTTTFTLPYSGVNPVVWRSGAVQTQWGDFTNNNNGTITFPTAPAVGEEIVATASVFNTTSGSGGGTMSTPVLIGTGNGVTTTFNLGATVAHEMIWKGGLIQLPTTDYTKSGTNITFVSGNVPASGEEIVASVELAPLVGTNAVTSNTASSLTPTITVVTSGSSYTILSTDYAVVVTKTSGSATGLSLPAGSLGKSFVIKDGKGDAGTNNITISPASGTIDGQSTFVIRSNYDSVTLVYNGTEWNVI